MLCVWITRIPFQLHRNASSIDQGSSSSSGAGLTWTSRWWVASQSFVARTQIEVSERKRKGWKNCTTSNQTRFVHTIFPFSGSACLPRCRSSSFEICCRSLLSHTQNWRPRESVSKRNRESRGFPTVDME